MRGVSTSDEGALIPVSRIEDEPGEEFEEVEAFKEFELFRNSGMQILCRWNPHLRLPSRT